MIVAWANARASIKYRSNACAHCATGVSRGAVVRVNYPDRRIDSSELLPDLTRQSEALASRRIDALTTCSTTRPWQRCFAPKLLAALNAQGLTVPVCRRLARLHSGFPQTNPHGSTLAVG